MALTDNRQQGMKRKCLPQIVDHTQVALYLYGSLAHTKAAAVVIPRKQPSSVARIERSQRIAHMQCRQDVAQSRLPRPQRAGADD